MRAYLARFALVLALVRVVESEGEVPEEICEGDLRHAWEFVTYFVAHARKVEAELRGRKARETGLSRALGEFLEEVGGEWEGTANELFDRLEEMGHEKALPKVPDSLTQRVLDTARKTPTLFAEKKRSGGKRRVRLAWSSGAETATG